MVSSWLSSDELEMMMRHFWLWPSSMVPDPMPQGNFTKSSVCSAGSECSYSTVRNALAPAPPAQCFPERGRRLSFTNFVTLFVFGRVPALCKAWVSQAGPASSRCSMVAGKSRPYQAPGAAMFQQNISFIMSGLIHAGSIWQPALPTWSRQAAARRFSLAKSSAAVRLSIGTSSSSQTKSAADPPGCSSVRTRRSLPLSWVLTQPDSGPEPVRRRYCKRSPCTCNSCTSAPQDSLSAVASDFRSCPTRTTMPPLSSPPTMLKTSISRLSHARRSCCACLALCSAFSRSRHSARSAALRSFSSIWRGKSSISGALVKPSSCSSQSCSFASATSWKPMRT
mmetsp:Transcript_57067/g.152789  ORF Transcript_57067/g.152789 Transcript_57067/m.152789 type:complete len:338 (-) Transcript_57067:68-1081(-)